MVITYDWAIHKSVKAEFHAEIAQNGGEYYGSVTFWALTVERKEDSYVLIVDGHPMTFDELVSDPVEVEK